MQNINVKLFIVRMPYCWQKALWQLYHPVCGFIVLGLFIHVYASEVRRDRKGKAGLGFFLELKDSTSSTTSKNSGKLIQERWSLIYLPWNLEREVSRCMFYKPWLICLPLIHIGFLVPLIPFSKWRWCMEEIWALILSGSSTV